MSYPTIITEIENADEERYNVLATPGTIVYSGVQKFQQGIDVGDGFQFYHLYLPASMIRESCLPNEANPREPSRGNSRETVIDKMHLTLQHEPHLFHHLNNGMTLVAESLSFDKITKTLTIDFSRGDGICNGGHTYFALSTFDGDLPDDCFVHLEIIQLPKDLEEDPRKVSVKNIATCRNRNRQLAPATQADYLNLYDEFKICLAERAQYIRWHEGDSEANEDSIDSVHFVRLLAALDPFWFEHPQHDGDTESNHGAAVRGKSAVHKKWFSAMESEDKRDDYALNLKHMALMSDDLLYLRDFLSKSLKDDDFGSGQGWRLRGTNFYDWLEKQKRELHHKELAGQTGLNLPDTFEVMVIGAFRNNIWLNFGPDDLGSPKYIGVYEPFENLWNEIKEDYMRELKGIFSSVDDNKNKFCKSDNALNIQLTKLLYGLRYNPTKPSYFYDIQDGQKYSRTEDEHPDFVLTIDPDENESELNPYSEDSVLDEFNIGYVKAYE